MTNVAYCAINEETNQFFHGKKGQVAFNKIGSLKISMNQNRIMLLLIAGINCFIIRFC